MRTLLALASLLAAGCSTRERYIVDGELVQRLQQPPPAPLLIAPDTWKIGHSTVIVECAARPNHYRAGVHGAAGWYNAYIDGPLDGDGLPCDHPLALRRIAVRAAELYRHDRGVVPAVRERDQVETHLYLEAIDARTLTGDYEGARVSVKRANRSRERGLVVLAAGGLLLTLASAIFIDAGAASCIDRLANPRVCSDDKGAWITLGALTAVPGAILAIVGGLLTHDDRDRHESEAPPDQSNLLYFGER